MLRDIASFETEFILSDLAIVENRIEKIKKQVQKINDDTLRKELPLLEKCAGLLQVGTALREVDFAADEQTAFRSYQFLSLKPLLLALNLDEAQRRDAGTHLKSVAAAMKGKNAKALAFSGKIEMELSELSDSEASAFMGEYGIEESALHHLIREAYDLLGLQSFFTVGEDECRAWTVKKGVTAQEAARAIHTDIADRFIRAEVVHYDDFISHGSFAKAKESGTWRLEGKEYPVKEGDIITFRNG
jgi:GTP-binding protein YchF